MIPKWNQKGPLERTISTRSAPWTPPGTKRVQRRPKDTKITEKVTSKLQKPMTKRNTCEKNTHIGSFSSNNKKHHTNQTHQNKRRQQTHESKQTRSQTTTLPTPATTQTATNQKGAGGRGEAVRSAAPACGGPGRDAKHRCKICQTLSENLSL